MEVVIPDPSEAPEASLVESSEEAARHCSAQSTGLARLTVQNPAMSGELGSCSLEVDKIKTSQSMLSSSASGRHGKLVASGKPFPSRPMMCKLSVKAWHKIEECFRLMDVDGSNAVTKAEATAFFKGAFAKMSADAFFNEVDVDGSGAITAQEFIDFWLQVRRAGYKEQDILDELDELIQGGVWVDWHDSRNASKPTVRPFPKRPFFSRLSRATWKKCEELFHRMDPDHTMKVTPEKAAAFFKDSFGQVSVEAMFNEVDEMGHGIITPQQFMNFWVQVRASGYSDKDIRDELENLLEGKAWVDWKDSRDTAGHGLAD